MTIKGEEESEGVTSGMNRALAGEGKVLGRERRMFVGGKKECGMEGRLMLAAEAEEAS